MLRRIALWGLLLIAALLAGGYIYLHQPFARDGTELLPVPLSPDDAELDRAGDLAFLGGLDIPRMGRNIGGLSALRWDAETGRLLALTDDARWVWITPQEINGQLIGITEIEVGHLRGLEGEKLSGKRKGDSESLTRSAQGGWLVGFERDHRVWRYPALDKAAVATVIDPVAALGAMEDNHGLEAMAGDERNLLACAERPATSPQANCAIYRGEAGRFAPFSVAPPDDIARLGGVPTDAAALSNGAFVVLFRSYSPGDGNGAAIRIYSDTGDWSELASFRPPLSVDNFEGLAVREEGNKTFLYIVSDDNFSPGQRTLLMKFEIPMSAL